MTGAEIVAIEQEAELLESGGKTDFRFGSDPKMNFEPVKVARKVKSGGKISLGGTEITFHLNAGHTKGATTFTFDARDNGKTYKVAIVNMGSINPGVNVAYMPPL